MAIYCLQRGDTSLNRFTYSMTTGLNPVLEDQGKVTYGYIIESFRLANGNVISRVGVYDIDYEVVINYQDGNIIPSANCIFMIECSFFAEYNPTTNHISLIDAGPNESFIASERPGIGIRTYGTNQSAYIINYQFMFNQGGTTQVSGIASALEILGAFVPGKLSVIPMTIGIMNTIFTYLHDTNYNDDIKKYEVGERYAKGIGSYFDRAYYKRNAFIKTGAIFTDLAMVPTTLRFNFEIHFIDIYGNIQIAPLFCDLYKDSYKMYISKDDNSLLTFVIFTLD